jgi:hypothetical protein
LGELHAAKVATDNASLTTTAGVAA